MINREQRTVQAGELIFQEGNAGDCAYLIERGVVLIFVNKQGVEVPLKVLGPGEVFGEMSLIDNSLRSASCRAIDPCTLIIVTREQILGRIQSADPVVRLLMHALLERLRQQNAGLSGKAIVPTHDSPERRQEREEVIARIEQENRIARALKNGEFIPHYQPICDLQTGRIIGCEALIRWQAPDGTLVSPAQFIMIMEESTLILRAGEIMVEKAMLDLHTVFGDFDPEFFVSINISGKQFAHPGFVDHLEQVRQKCALPASRVKLEVTEGVMMEGPQAASTLQACRLIGYKLAIDDFGTGFSSLQYLASMPLTDLKIDRSFVMGMMTNQRSLTVVTALVQMAKLLDLNVIAEGVESEEQRNLLRGFGVAMGQGYLFSRPITAKQLRALVKPITAKAA